MESKASSESQSEVWARLVRRYRGALAALAVRSGLSAADGEKVADEVLRSAQRLEAGVGPSRSEGVRAWLYELARWRIAARLRRLAEEAVRQQGVVRASAAGGSQAAPLETQEAAPELDVRRQAQDFALYRVASRASARDFQLFELALKQGWSVRRIARALGLNLWLVWTIKHRLSRQFRRELTKLRSCWR